MKDKAKGDVVIVFMDPGVMAFPRKRARRPDTQPANAQQETRHGLRPGFFAQFYRMTFSTRVTIRSQEKFSNQDILLENL
jgi:hypothetical protein